MEKFERYLIQTQGDFNYPFCKKIIKQHLNILISIRYEIIGTARAYILHDTREGGSIFKSGATHMLQ